MKYCILNIILIAFTSIILVSCSNKSSEVIHSKLQVLNSIDSTNHGYNELANPNNIELFAISDFNTDNPDIDNIDRPKTFINTTQIDTNLLFGIWTSNPNGPHADFLISSESFYVVDYDGDGSMSYKLTDKHLKIYYNDFIQEGNIISVNRDTLKITWKDFTHINNYVRWTQ